MAFNVSALEEYVNQNTLPLLKTASLGAVTQGIINIQTGVKHKSALNVLTVDPTLQTGSCAFNDAGTATFSQREIAVGDIKINMSFCLNTLESKWMNYLAKNTAGAEVLPFEEVLLSEIATKIASAINAKDPIQYNMSEFGYAFRPNDEIYIQEKWI